MESGRTWPLGSKPRKQRKGNNTHHWYFLSISSPCAGQARSPGKNDLICTPGKPEAGTIPSSHGREGNGRRERFTHASEGTQLIHGGGQTPVRAVPLSAWYSHLPWQEMAPRYILGPGSASSSPIGPRFRGPSYSGIIRIFLVGTAWPLDLFEAQFPKPWLSLDSTLLFPGRLSWQTLPVIQLMMLWVQERDAPTQPVLKKKLSYPRNRCGVLHLSGLQQSLLAASTNLSIPNLIRQTGGQLSS